MTSSPATVWSGPFIAAFHFRSLHSRTVRYDAPVGENKFALYAPKFMLDQIRGNDWPELIIVGVAASADLLSGFHFDAASEHPVSFSDVDEFPSDREHINSVRYQARRDDENFEIYVPREVFGSAKFPGQVFLRLARL